MRQTLNVEVAASYKEGIRAPLIVAGLVGLVVVAIGAAIEGEPLITVVLVVAALVCGFGARNYCYRVTVGTDGEVVLHYLFGNRKTRVEAVSRIVLDPGGEEFSVEFEGGCFEMLNTPTACSVVNALLLQKPNIALWGYRVP